MRFNLLKDTDPPKIKVSFTGNKNNKTMFTADFTAIDDENRSEYASSLEYEYDPWVNSYNDIIGDKIKNINPTNNKITFPLLSSSRLLL